MTITKKFSQFNGPDPIQNGDIVVGLRVGPQGLDNWQFTGVGGGGGGGGVVIATITQAGNTFVVGDWVECIAGVYQLAQANNAMNAEVIGVVQSIITQGLTFTVQQSGYITTLGTLTPLIPSVPYYLDPDTMGAMTQTEPTVNGEVSRPVLIADSPSTAWVLPYRGYVINGGSPVNPGTGLITRNIHQIGHGFVVGNWIRTDGTTPGTQYVLAYSDNLADAQAIGVVIAVQDDNNFTVQVDGYLGNNTFALITPGPTLTVGGIYYLSDTQRGVMTLTVPSTLGEATKPLFSADSTTTGWILPQRPLTITNNGGGGGTGVTYTVTQNPNDFNVGDWLRLDMTSPDALYTRAQADSAMDAEVIGVVQSIIVPGVQFVIQQSGYLTTFTGKVPGGIYFLDDASAGAMSLDEPVTNGHVSRPVYIAQNASNGWVLPYRGYVINGGAPVNPGGGIVTRTITQPNHPFEPGDWVRTAGPAEAPNTPYNFAQADTLAHAQVVGLVINKIDVNNFVLQEVGYVGPGVFSSGIAAGTINYLSPTSAGEMQPTAPTGAGQITKPVFSGESATTGWILPQRPLPIVAGANNPIFFTLNQPISLALGQWVRTSNVAGAPYALALADNLADSWAVGVVIQILVAGSSYIIQQSGYVSGGGVFSGLAQGTIYYLSDTMLGAMQPTEPTIIGEASRPLFSADSPNSGWILPVRSNVIATNANTSIINVTQNNTFTVGQFVATTTANDQYVLAIADTMTHAYKASGFVIAATPTSFTLQQSGYCQAFVSLPSPFPPLAAGKSYWLSPTNPGQIQVTEPVGLTAVSRPVLNATDPNSGWILPQRPVLNASGITPPGGGAWQLIQTTNITPLTTFVDLPGIFGSTYADIRIVGRNLQFQYQATPSVKQGVSLGMQLYVGGVLIPGNSLAANNYWTSYPSLSGVAGSGQGNISPVSNGWLIIGSGGGLVYYSNYAQCLTFTVDMFSIANTTCLKNVEFTTASQVLANINSPPYATTTYWIYAGLCQVAPLGTLTGPITGVYFSLIPAPSISGPQSVFTSGQISIYGLLG